jgi:pyrimidine operon attenuation protein/uracil phosphoribosyltransferase
VGDPTPSEAPGYAPPRTDPLTRSSEAGKETNDHARHDPASDCARPVSQISLGAETLLLDEEAISRTLSRIAHEIIERTDVAEVALVGIHTRGVPLAQRLRRLIEDFSGETVELGALDITFHRDDVHVRASGEAPLHAQPLVRDTKLDFPLEGKTIVLVDDVLYTGRTIRAAIDGLFDYGRPARVQLAVLADRGHRELPIRPDYVGKNLPTARGERVQVQLVEVDEIDRVLLLSTPEETHHG